MQGALVQAGVPGQVEQPWDPLRWHTVVASDEPVDRGVQARVGGARLSPPLSG